MSFATNPVATQFTGDAKPFFVELNKVRNELGGFRKDVSNIANSVKNLFAGYLGFRAITGSIRSVIDATAEAQAAQAQLNNALATAGAPVAAASAEFQAYATQLQRATTFSDEAIQNVETLLLSFKGLSGNVVKDATATVLDLSTRMGIDAPAAAKLLGKALSDPEKGLTALARAGVTFTDSQKAQIKGMKEAGDLAGAQAIILKSLEDRFGGAAEAARGTFGGALTGLKNVFGDLLEGGSGMNAAAESINHLTDVLSSPEIRFAFQELISGLGTVIRLAAEAAAGIALLFTGRGGNESVDIDLQIEKLEKQRKAIEGTVGMRRPDGMWDMGPMYDEKLAEEDLKRLKAIEAELAKLHDLQAQLLGLGEYGPGGALAEVKLKSNVKRIRPKGSAALDFVTGGDTAAADAQAELSAELRKQIEKDQAALVDALEAMTDASMKIGQEEVDRAMAASQFFEDMRQQDLDREEEYQQARVAAEYAANEKIQQFRERGVNAAANLLQVLFGKHKAAAVAIFLIQKRQAIAETVINTKQAVMATYARLGYPWGIPAAVAVAALGAAQLAEMVATNPGTSGLVTGGSTGGGAVYAPGTPNNPVFTQAGNVEQGGARAQRVLTVHFNGPVYGMDDFKRQITQMLADEINDRDVVIINPLSRQAQELKA
jgi:hypothetical protein